MIRQLAQNDRKIHLTESDFGETVGVLRKDGALRYCWRRGFIDVAQVKRLASASPSSSPSRLTASPTRPR